MPSSRPDTINSICDIFLSLKEDENKILDLGMGFGKYGVLAREYTDIWRGNIDPGTWRVQIDGVEGFTKYVGSWQHSVYTHIIFDDILNFMRNLTGRYHLVLLIDVLEHFTKEEGKELLDLLRKKSDRFIVVTPINPSSQKDVNGNILETHKSKWDVSSLGGYGELYANNRAYILVGYGMTDEEYKKNQEEILTQFK